MLVVASVLALPLAAADEPLELYPEPKTAVAHTVQQLFNWTFGIAMVVFVGVEGFLFFTIWKFRRNKVVPANEEHRGHTRAEVIWTVIPAAILLVLGSVSAAQLFTIDEVPKDTDYTVRVEAARFSWSFVYPDGNKTINDLRVREGSKVALDIVSKDVEHQFFVPAFAIKISAIPGRTNHQWFIAPEPGTYHFECTMYCGNGHHLMGANSDDTHITVFAKSASYPYGKEPKVPIINATG